MAGGFTNVIQHFSSLDACIRHIKTNFSPTKTTRLTIAKDIETGQVISVEIPAYLYRGESRAYPTTTSTMHRLKSDDVLPLGVRQTIEQTTTRLDHELQEFMELAPMLSAGFLQHYGAPTELLDVTSSLDVTAFFATGNEGATGLVCVFPISKIASRSIIIDLTEHPGAERPRRQSAYAFFHRSHVDLKSDDAIDDLQLKWFSFSLTKNDKAKYGANLQILDACTDQVAGVLQLLLDGFDKICDPAAQWLSDRIVPAPFVTRLIDEYSPGQPRTVELMPLCQSSVNYNEQEERQSNYHKWSLNFPDTSKHKLPL